MNKKNILVVEDQEDILELIKINLIKNGYNTIGVTSGEEALEVVKKTNFDIILLDLMLPGIDGIKVCKNLKNNEFNSINELPVIMLTARGEEEDIIKGLESGADDYITKPFSPKVLLARIKSVLRRQSNSSYDKTMVINIQGLYIHPVKHEITLNNKPLKLTSSEFKALHLLAGKPGWVLTRYQIIDEIKGEDYFVTDRAVDVLMVGLRKKLGDFGLYIETVRGIGYKFKNNMTKN